MYYNFVVFSDMWKCFKAWICRTIFTLGKPKKSLYMYSIYWQKISVLDKWPLYKCIAATLIIVNTSHIHVIWNLINFCISFFSSYSYDLTHRLQYNMTSSIPTDVSGQSKCLNYSLTISNVRHTVHVYFSDSRCIGITSLAFDLIQCSNWLGERSWERERERERESELRHDLFLYCLFITFFIAFITACPGTLYGVRTKPVEKYVWNSYLLQKCQDAVHPDWLLFLIHGFVDQKSILCQFTNE